MSTPASAETDPLVQDLAVAARELFEAAHETYEIFPDALLAVERARAVAARLEKKDLRFRLQALAADQRSLESRLDDMPARKLEQLSRLADAERAAGRTPAGFSPLPDSLINALHQALHNARQRDAAASVLDQFPINLEALVDLALEDAAFGPPVQKAMSREEAIATVERGREDISSLGRLEKDRISTARREAEATEWAFASRLPVRPVLLALGAVLAFVALIVVDAFTNTIERSPFGWIAALVVAWLFGSAAIGDFRSWVRAGNSAKERHRAAYRRASDAERELEQVRVEAGVKPLLRAEVHRREGNRYDTTIRSVTGEGLAELFDPDHLVPTAARMALDQRLATMKGGSIGLSGPRGVGKSTLIRASCEPDPETASGVLGVVIAAPVKVDARDFILHLFAEVCRAALGDEAVNALREPDPMLGKRFNALDLGFLGPFVAIGALLAGLTMLFVATVDAPASVAWASVLILAGGIGCLRGYSRYGRRFWRGSVEAIRVRGLVVGLREPAGLDVSNETRTLAASRLRDIWFQQSFTTGWSGALTLPIGVEAGVEGSRELARQQLSMPEVVGELRRLVKALTEDESHPLQVRIGIDELDKIESIEEASQFLNEIKVLFGIQHCFFLVSISEDALASFERRGLPLRDVFDSSFDDVIRVDYLNADASVRLLNERTFGMPVPFMLLCHVMAGGLPRDLIRMAREVVFLVRQRFGREWTLTDVTHGLVGSQLNAKVKATMHHLHRYPASSALEQFQDWLQSYRSMPIHARALMTLVHDAPQQLPVLLGDRNGDSKTETPRARAIEFIAYCYFCATVLEFFAEARPSDQYLLHEDRPAEQYFREVDEYQPDGLAAAHQAFAIHPEAAWGATNRVRDGLAVETLEFSRFGRKSPE